MGVFRGEFSFWDRIILAKDAGSLYLDSLAPPEYPASFYNNLGPLGIIVLIVWNADKFLYLS